MESMKVKRIYRCVKCGGIVIRYRPLGAKPYVKWCCGEKMILIRNKCSICKMEIRGVNHFQGSHHLTAAAMLAKAEEVSVGG